MNLSRITLWGWFWLTWAMVGGVVEVYWVIVKGANTLSRQIWGIERLDFAHPLDFGAWTWEHWLIALVFWTFFLWLSFHFPFGWFR